MHKRFVIILSLLIIFGSSGIAQEKENDYAVALKKGIEFFEQKNYDESEIQLKKAFNIAQSIKDSTSVVQSGGDLIKVLVALRKHAEIFPLIDTRQEYFYKGMPKRVEIETSMALASAYIYTGNLNRSVEEYEKAFSITDSSSYPLLYGKIAHRLGDKLVSLSDFDRAISLHEKALSTFQKLQEKYLTALAYQSLYVDYLYIAEPETAIPFLFKGYEIVQELDDQTLLLRYYRYLSDYHQSKEEYSSAINFIEKGLKISEALKDERSSAVNYKTLGELYLLAKEPERALSFLNRAYRYYNSIGDNREANKALLRIGEAYMNKEDFIEGERVLLQALSYYSESGNFYDYALNVIFLAELKLRVNDHKAALEYLTTSLSIGEENDIILIIIWSEERLVNIHDSLFSKEKKLLLSKKIYAYSKRLTEDYKLTSAIKLSRAYAAVDSDSSFFYANEAFELIEKKRLSFMGGQLKANIFMDHAGFYNEVASWYATRKKDYSKAFELVEASKARALTDQLAEGKSNEIANIEEADRIKLLELQKGVDQLYSKKEEARDDEEIESLKDEIADQEVEYDVLLEEISSKNETLKTFIYPKTRSLKEAQKLCDSETVIIEYAFTNNKLLIFIISQKEVAYFETKESPDAKKEIATQIERFRNAIITQGSKSELGVFSDSVSKQLLEPIFDEIKEFKNWIVIPDGSITLLPFGSLLKNQRYLIQDYTIKYLPSISAYEQIKNPFRDTEKALLAFASSGFVQGDDQLNTSTQASFASLPYTLIEVDSVAAKFKEKTVLKNDDVTEAAFKQIDLNKYKYIHFATHGDINEINPRQSGLILSRKKETEILFGEDGFLNAKEIAGLSLSADMVVLSACDTGTGKVISGEGLLGLQRSFLIAGASSVVSSLWSIYDRSTPVFMESFYTELIQHEEEELGLFNRFLVWAELYEPRFMDHKAIALRDAKLKMIDHPYYHHPVHWASFTLTGK